MVLFNLERYFISQNKIVYFEKITVSNTNIKIY
jgi:hypothetical protein